VVSVDDHQLHLSGRDLHESAKMALNAGDFTKSLSMFEAILMAQAQRFGPCHPSVAAAMHNVGGMHIMNRLNMLFKAVDSSSFLCSPLFFCF
jgi:hypothetical protein